MPDRDDRGLQCTAAVLAVWLLLAVHPVALHASVDPGPDGRPRPERSRWQAGATGIDEQAASLMIAVERAFDANDPRAALTILSKLRELRPRDPTVWNSIGYALVQIRDLNGAAVAYQKAVDVDPNYAEGAYNLALAFIDLNKPDDARRSLQPWASRIRDYPVMGVLLAKIEDARGQHAGAVGFIDLVLAAPKIKPLVLFEAASLLKDWGDARAEGALQRVIAEDPDMIGAPLNLANIMRNSGRSGEARKILDNLARRMPDHPSVLRERGGLNVQEVRLEEAVFDLDRAVARKPEMAEASIVAAECLVKLGRRKDALLRLDSVLDPARSVPDRDRAAARKLKDAIVKVQSQAPLGVPQPAQQQGAAVQDNTLPSSAFTKATTKAGVPHVEAPIELLERMLIVRVHLDPVTMENGPMLVIPASHRDGKRVAVESQAAVALLHDAGDMLVIRPLMQHRSLKSTEGTRLRRRVVHLELAPEVELPDGYRWRWWIRTPVTECSATSRARAVSGKSPTRTLCNSRGASGS
jgi:Flp pilus assembly protein TadD